MTTDQSIRAVNVIRVEPSLAREIAAEFLDARSAPAAPLVVAAYSELEVQTNAMFEWITDTRRPSAIRVVFTRSGVPYCGDRELIECVRADRMLEVASAACERNRCHPLMGCGLGGTYDRFRAVHDILGHAAHQLGFDRDGEYASWLIQDRQYRGLARWALATELHGEHSVRWTSGDVADHKAALLPRGLLRRSIEAAGQLATRARPPSDCAGR
jgi:hypothetical protein